MNFKQKLVYMFIGCLFTIAGYILASLGGETTHAQQFETQDIIERYHFGYIVSEDTPGFRCWDVNY